MLARAPDIVLRAHAAPTLAAFADVWPTLAKPGPSQHCIFQTADFLDVWLETIGAARGVRPSFICIDDPQGSPALLLPLGVERRRGVSVLTFTDGGVSDYNAPILFPEAHALQSTGARALWRLIVSAAPLHDAAALDKMPAFVEGVANPLHRLAPFASAPSGYAVRLHDDWRTYEAQCLHRPKDSRRKRRGLAREGALEFRIAASVRDAQLMLREIMRMKTRRYVELNGEDGFDRPGYRHYFPTLTERLFHTGCVHVSVLEVGGRIVAGHWGLVAGKRFYCLMLAFEDCASARLSPGRLLVENLVEWSFAKRLDWFDLGYGDAPWKRLFAPEILPLSHAALPLTPLGWAYVEGKRLQRRWLPEPKRKLDAHAAN